MDVLINKQYKKNNLLSRYGSTPFYYHTVDDRYIVGKDAWLDDTTPYTAHKVKQGDTFDTLALYYYNDPTYFWIICSYNHIADPYTELKVGSIIKIPSLGNIRFKL